MATMKEVVEKIEGLFSHHLERPIGIQIGAISKNEMEKQKILNFTVAYAVDRVSVTETLKKHANLLIHYKEYRNMFLGEKLNLTKTLIRKGVNLYALGKAFDNVKNFGPNTDILQNMLKAEIQEPIIAQNENNVIGYVAKLSAPTNLYEITTTLSKNIGENSIIQTGERKKEKSIDLLATIIGYSINSEIVNKLMKILDKSSQGLAIITSKIGYEEANDLLNIGANIVKIEEQPAISLSLKRLAMNLDLELRSLEARAYYVESERLLFPFTEKE